MPRDKAGGEEDGGPGKGSYWMLDASANDMFEQGNYRRRRTRRQRQTKMLLNSQYQSSPYAFNFPFYKQFESNQSTSDEDQLTAAQVLLAHQSQLFDYSLHFGSLFDINSTLFLMSNPHLKLSPDQNCSPANSDASPMSTSDPEEEKLDDKKTFKPNKFSIENLIRKD